MNIKDNFPGILVITLLALYLPATGFLKSRTADSVKDSGVKVDTSTPAIEEQKRKSELNRLLGEFIGLTKEEVKTYEKLEVSSTKPYLVNIKHEPAESKQKVYFADPGDLKHHGYNITFLIATVPDPFDSHTGWLFDQFVGSIQRAVEHAGYQFDRYWLPWKRDSKENEYREKPGILLFVKERTVLVVFLVGEIPTSGIHKLPFAEALNDIAYWKGYGTEKKKLHDKRIQIEKAETPKIQTKKPLHIDVLGPSFSGSVKSIRNVIQILSESRRDLNTHFNFVSGSATAIFKKSFEQSIGENQISYRTTVRSEKQLLLAILRRFIWQKTETGPIAILSDNTGYGENLRDNLKTIKEGFDKKDVDKLGEFIELRFPLHISVVRTEYEKGKASGKPLDSSKIPVLGLELSLSEEGTSQDVLPPMTPGISSSSADLVLSNILSTINRENVRHVGLLATDTRDKLFLAEQIRIYCPNVQIFTTDADLLYYHRQYVRFTRGMIVASTYPLFNLNQKWSAGFTGKNSRLQFPNNSSQGVFNAVLVLLHEKNVSFVEYGLPFENEKSPTKNLPPVWITAVGYRGFVPMWRMDEFEEDRYEDNYLYDPQVKTAPKAEKLFAPPQSKFLNGFFFVLCVFSLIHFLGFYDLNRRTKRFQTGVSRRWFPSFRLDDLDNKFSLQQMLYLFALFVILLILCAEMMILVTFWPTLGNLILIIFGSITIFLLLVGITYLIIQISKCPMGKWRSIAIISLSIAILIVAASLYYHHSRIGMPAKVFLYLRAGDPLSGLSPIVPLLFLSANVYLWVFLQIKRMYLLRTSDLHKDLLNISRVAYGELKDLRFRIVRIIAQSIFRQREIIIILAFIIITSVLHIGRRFLPTLESHIFDTSFRLLMLFSLISILIALFRFAILSWNLVRLSRAISAHSLIEAYSRVPKTLTADLGRSFYIERPNLRQLSVTLIPAKKVLKSTPEALKDYEGSLHKDLNRFGPEWPWCNCDSYKTYAQLWRKTEEVVRTAKGADSGWIKAAEEFLVIRPVFLFREIFIHLRNYLGYATIGALSLLASITYYPFQPKRVFMTYLIGLILAISSCALVFFIQMSRDEILSRLFGTEINKVSWDRSFVARIVLYVLIPILSIVAVQFPEIGGFLVSILDPVQRSMP